MWQRQRWLLDPPPISSNQMESTSHGPDMMPSTSSDAAWYSHLAGLWCGRFPNNRPLTSVPDSGYRTPQILLPPFPVHLAGQFVPPQSSAQQNNFERPTSLLQYQSPIRMPLFGSSNETSNLPSTSPYPTDMSENHAVESDDDYEIESNSEVIVLESCIEELDESEYESYSETESESDKKPLEETVDMTMYRVIPQKLPMIPPVTLKTRSRTLSKLLPPPSPRALKVACMVLKHARDNPVPNEEAMGCKICHLFPVFPVTLDCGHTSCYKCMAERHYCPCGMPPRGTMHVSTLVQEIISLYREPYVSYRPRLLQIDEPGKRSRTGKWQGRSGVRNIHRSQGFLRSRYTSKSVPGNSKPRKSPLTNECRYTMARQLIEAGRFLDAAPHIAHVAASNVPYAEEAQNLLAQVITKISKNSDPRRLTRILYQAVRRHSASNWLKASDMECILCCETLTRPVTTPCGHTYCRTCLERSMDYRSTCALCLRFVKHFDVEKAPENAFIVSALASINAINDQGPFPLSEAQIRIFVCTVGYPEMPCPLFIFDPRYWLMIRRVLESDNRRFGMVHSEESRAYSNFGTVLEIRDCVHLEDGSCIVSTIGVSRFKVIEKTSCEGYDVARIEALVDDIPTSKKVVWALRVVASRIASRALLWLGAMDWYVLGQIEATFGKMPDMDVSDGMWWNTPDGPAWLWWLICILPLRTEIKALILSTNDLMKRMMAVSRTLEAVEQVTFAHEIEAAIHSSDHWLNRHAQD